MLTFNLKKEWFEKIKSGEKTHEYREVKPYWTKRLRKLKSPLSEMYYTNFDITNPILQCRFCLGYPQKTDTEKQIQAVIKNFCIILNGKSTDLKIDKPVYDIEFEVIK